MPGLQLITPYSIHLGVIGAGTMGSGIALTALLAGMVVTLFDVSPDMLEKAGEYIDQHLSKKGKEKNRINLKLVTDIDALRGSGIVIEAAPEELLLKQDLFRKLDVLCPPPAILATNTSTLPVTAIASAAQHPQRVAGMHFFNPAPVLPLVEIIRGAQTSTDTIHTLVELAERLGKTAVVVHDTPGFIVNRVARPFYSEALRLLGEGAATHEQIDQIVRLGGGFSMGPFQLMDLIGVDINLKAMQSLYDQTYGEPRYRPHPIQVRMVQQKALGRKTRGGFYDYNKANNIQPDSSPPITRQTGLVWLMPGEMSPGIADVIRQVGFTLTYGIRAMPSQPVIAIAAASTVEGLKRQLSTLDRDLPENTPILCQCADVTLTEAATWIHHPERLVGFDGLFFSKGGIATLVAIPTLARRTRDAVENFMTALGRLVIWVADTPGLVLPRIICMLSNEAAFAVQEGVAEVEKIDLAMRLGVNYPKGPITWAKEIGYTKVISVLDHLYSEFHEDRYRASPLLRRWERLGRIIA